MQPYIVPTHRLPTDEELALVHAQLAILLHGAYRRGGGRPPRLSPGKQLAKNLATLRAENSRRRA